jgi:hypothetical protein
MKVLGIDPGKTTGWGLLDCSPVERKVVRVGEWKEAEFEDELLKILREEPVDALVIEDFVFRPNFKEGKWKTTEVSKLIGKASTCAKLFDCIYVEQPPAIKPVGYGMAKLKYVKGKRGTHMQDAVAHATYYYMTKGIKLGNK